MKISSSIYTPTIVCPHCGKEIKNEPAKLKACPKYNGVIPVNAISTHCPKCKGLISKPTH
ncbi:MAG: hypothetical protein FWG87_11870 [Defluviitaleaceae bacterium]|nr:hypothetical protein [Defluviitaleaceae bacterium]